MTQEPKKPRKRAVKVVAYMGKDDLDRLEMLTFYMERRGMGRNSSELLKAGLRVLASVPLNKLDLCLVTPWEGWPARKLTVDVDGEPIGGPQAQSTGDPPWKKSAHVQLVWPGKPGNA
jgi:hypothetical protein